MNKAQITKHTAWRAHFSQSIDNPLIIIVVPGRVASVPQMDTTIPLLCQFGPNRKRFNQKIGIDRANISKTAIFRLLTLAESGDLDDQKLTTTGVLRGCPRAIPRFVTDSRVGKVK